MSKLFVVDDDRAVLEGFRAVLHGEEHEVILAESGERAVQLVPEHNPDILIMDIRMPGIEVLESFRRFRQSRHEDALIIMTGYSTTESAIEATKWAYEYVVNAIRSGNHAPHIDSALHCVADGSPRALDPGPRRCDRRCYRWPSQEMQQLYG
jgi:two-component system NtrC family response regulator/two-component system nitrogen regulation response regulator GlnG